VIYTVLPLVYNRGTVPSPLQQLLQQYWWFASSILYSMQLHMLYRRLMCSSCQA
jgi:hypothetical protein